MDSFKTFFGSTMGIVAAILILLFGICLCCLVFYAIGLNEVERTPISLVAPAAVLKSS